jgi:DNA-binding CsgD family transcriptional regulator/tetratricopeptide (TPR) repeat protein
VATRVSSRRFVGREPQLALLTRIFAEAESGRARLALVAGESGVGKTRLVDELAVHARERGARVLFGDCVELAEGELPYAPIIGALRGLIRAGEPALAEVRAELERPDGPDHGAQGRFFELLLTALDRLSAEAPLVLVLEDIHWADRSTRDFLAFLARNLCAERALVVATYRTDELFRRHPLRALLPEIERLESTARVELDRLTRAELADQLADILGEAPAPALVDRLYRRCEGNPLFAEELLAAGLDGRADLPPTLRDALTVRVESLAEPTQELLRVVSAAVRADEALLGEVSELERAELRAGLREALAHQVLVHGADGRYAFRHALLREAVHDDLLPGEHVELHHQLARALEQRVESGSGDLDTVTAVAHHYFAAGQQPEALGAAVRAAAAAERIHAPAEEAAQLERVLTLWARVPDAEERAGHDQPRLLERLAIACDALGDNERAVHALRSALEEIGPDAPPLRIARLLERLGRGEWQRGRASEALDAYERGLALLPADGVPTAERALLLAAKGKALMLAGAYTDSVDWCEQALSAARGCGSRRAEADALTSLGVSRAGLGDVEGGIACLEESIAMGWADDRLSGVTRGYINLGDVQLVAGRTHEALATVSTALAELEARGRRPLWLSLQAAETALAAGDWAETERRVDPARAPRYVGTTAVYFDVVAADLAISRGDHLAALPALERARSFAGAMIDPQWHAPIASLLGEALRREQRLDEARAIAEEAYARITQMPRMQDHLRVARLAAAALAVEADAAQRARDLGDPGSEADALARAHAWTERARAAGAGTMPGTARWVAFAEAEASRAAGRSDADAWAAAAAAWEACEQPYTAARARWREAEARAQTGDRAGAQQAARAAHTVAVRVGSRWLAAEIESLARRARLRLAEPDDAAVDGTAEVTGLPDPVAELGLTPREREVLQLLADGRTNREIGETLFMAEKTASVHVSRILAKLDVRSRTEAAAVAHRLGLGA